MFTKENITIAFHIAFHRYAKTKSGLIWCKLMPRDDAEVAAVAMNRPTSVGRLFPMLGRNQ